MALSPALAAAQSQQVTSRLLNWPLCGNLGFDPLCAFQFVLCHKQRLVVVTPVDLGNLGVYRRRLLVVGEPFRKWRLLTWSKTR